MFEFLSRAFVELGYMALALNGILALRRAPYSWHRRIAMAATVVIALLWTVFYTAVNFHLTDPAVLPLLSRLFHTTTIGGLMAQQFLIQKASGGEPAYLQTLLEQSLRPTDD